MATAPEKKGNTSAKILYQPFGLVSSIIAGVVAGQVSSRSGSGPRPATTRTHRGLCSRSTPSRR